MAQGGRALKARGLGLGCRIDIFLMTTAFRVQGVGLTCS